MDLWSRNSRDFDAAAYERRVRNMTPDALWSRQCLQYRKKVCTGTAVGFSSLFTLSTFGSAAAGLVTTGQALHVARKKEKMVAEEVARRNLPPYRRKKRDVFMPLGVSLTAYPVAAVLDAVSGSAVVDGFVNRRVNAVYDMGDPKNDSLGSTWQGIKVQTEEFFHAGGTPVGLDQASVRIDIGPEGLYICTVVPEVSPSEGCAIATSPVGNVKANTAVDLHQDNITRLKMGTELEETVEEVPAYNPIVGKSSVHEKTSGMLDSWGTETRSVHDEESSAVVLAQPPSSEQTIEDAYAAVLTGKTRKRFIFLSEGKQPTSQYIVTPTTTQKCRHFSEKTTKRTCRFCEATIDAASHAYYHCCSCSSQGDCSPSGFNICEVCVAGRGCSCPYRVEHILYRLGHLASTVDYGKLHKGHSRRFRNKKSMNEQNKDDKEYESKSRPANLEKVNEALAKYIEKRHKDSSDKSRPVDLEKVNKALAEYLERRRNEQDGRGMSGGSLREDTETVISDETDAPPEYELVVREMESLARLTDGDGHPVYLYWEEDGSDDEFHSARTSFEL